MYFLMVQDGLQDSNVAFLSFNTLRAAKNSAENEYDPHEFTFTVLHQDRKGKVLQVAQAKQRPAKLKWK